MMMERNKRQSRSLATSSCIIDQKNPNSNQQEGIYLLFNIMSPGTIIGSQVQIGSLCFGVLIITHGGGGQPVHNQHCPFLTFQLIFPCQGLRRHPRLAYNYFTFWGLCKLKGILAWIRQPNANNPHLGETVHCYPSKHKHLLVTHSKQKWPMRDESAALSARAGSTLLSDSFFLSLTYCTLPESHHSTSFGENLTGMGRDIAFKTCVTQPDTQTRRGPHYYDHNTSCGTATKWYSATHSWQKKSTGPRDDSEQGGCAGARRGVFVLTCSGSHSSGAFTVVSEHTSPKHNAKSTHERWGFLI